MIIYITLLVSVTLLLIKSRRKKNRNIFIYISFILMVLTAGLRDGVGTDYAMYKEFFYNSGALSILSIRLEPLFTIIAKITHSIFSQNYWTMFFVFAFITYLLIFKCAIDNVKNYWMCIFLFLAFSFYFSSFNLVRQWFAIAFMIESANNLCKKNIKKSILYYILAILSHFSSIIFIPFFIASFFIKENRTRIIIIVTAVCIYIFDNNFNQILEKIVSLVSVFNKYEKYLYYADIKTNVFVFPMFCLAIYGLYLLFVNFKKSDMNNLLFNSFSINMTVFGFGVSLIGTRMMIFERVQFYPLVFLIYSLPLIIDSVSNKKNKRILSLIILILGFSFFVYSLLNNGGQPLPYKTIFSGI